MPSRTSSLSPVRYTVLKSLFPLAILTGLLFVVINSRPDQQGNADINKNSVPSSTPDSARFLIKPYFVRPSQIAVALNGGDIPVPDGQVPSIIIGRNVLRMVPLCWVHDWTDPEARTSFQALQALYDSKDGASLPALRIYLAPVFSSPESEAIQRAMLQVFFRSDNRGLYQILAKELSTGALAADPEAIRSRVEAIEPLLMDDWGSRLDWLESDIEKTFSVAKTQQARHAKLLNPAFRSQLASMLEILPPASGQKELISFIHKANETQGRWLDSQPRPQE